MAGSSAQIAIMVAYMVILYYVTYPGVLVELPGKTADPMLVKIVHGLVFAAVFMATSQYVTRYSSSF
jgi:hypothetical protein